MTLARDLWLIFPLCLACAKYGDGAGSSSARVPGKDVSAASPSAEAGAEPTTFGQCEDLGNRARLAFQRELDASNVPQCATDRDCRPFPSPKPACWSNCGSDTDLGSEARAAALKGALTSPEVTQICREFSERNCTVVQYGCPAPAPSEAQGGLAVSYACRSGICALASAR